MTEPTNIADAITAAQQRVADCYTAISNKGGTLPQTQNLANMPTAIGSIQTGGTLITKSITANGTYNASSDNADGYSSVTVSVSGGYSEFPSYQVSSGVAGRRSGSLTGNEFSNITTVNDYCFYDCFYECNGMTGVVSFPSLTSVGTYSFYRAFYNCTGITSVSFASLKTINSYGLYQSFYGCSGITSVNFSLLETVDNSGLYRVFYNCPAITRVDFTKLNSIGSQGLYQAFYGNSAIEDIYFNSLTTNSFGSYTNQFQNMLSSTGTNKTHTLHFPSNLTSKISALSGYPLFGGTSGYVTISFDLPATS